MFGHGKTETHGSTWGLFYVPRMTRSSGIFVDDAGGGYVFSEFFKILAQEKNMTLPRLVVKFPDNAVNEYLRNYGMVAVVRDQEGNKMCWSVNYRNRLPLVFTDRLRAHFGLMPDDTVLWSDDVFREPREAPAREVVYGERPEKPPKKQTRAEVRKKWAKPDELSSHEWDYLSGKTEEEPPGL